MGEKLVQLAGWDFDRIYKKYPRKEGKTIGMQRLKKQIKTLEQYIAFTQATHNYTQLCIRDRRASVYIKHWATFTNCWEEYLSAADFQLPEQEDEPAMRAYREMLRAVGISAPECAWLALRIFAKYKQSTDEFRNWLNVIVSRPKAEGLEAADPKAFERYLIVCIERETSGVA